MGLYRDNIGLYRGFIGTMEKKTETTIYGLGFRGFRFRIHGFWFRVQGLVFWFQCVGFRV